MRYLHVLNGDATREVFDQSNIPGEKAVWREMLCEGKTPVAEDMQQFLEERAAYLQQQHGMDSNAYLRDMRETCQQLDKAAGYDEIVLWFEFDLFCQVNLLFVLNYLQQLSIQLPRVSIVQIDQHPDVPDFRGMGMLQAHHLPPLFDNREYLQEEDWQLARQVWQAYTGDNPQTLETLIQRPSPHLRYLGKALQAHLQRLPGATNGLNAVEYFFLDRLALGKLREQALYYQFWNERKIYGFGDFQLDLYIQRLQRAGVLQREEMMLSITGLGKEVLNNEQNYLSFASQENLWLGGISLADTPWRWDADEGRVIHT